ncbi:hypothetical protein [Paenibacillus paeoniae]|uniref:Uncharacterized protein n=1 Tax=Paenibacillus paeoniae TaxID=2292705 RepID=A0A371PN97_9BACL|nr:hypothetical protein [Paenibacillus paeoniae]REK77257.1 hypothetical protein DX130_09720 [Paenibacillus paeoniae]
MRIDRSIVIACAVTLVITIGGAWLPHTMMKTRDSGGEVAVFRGAPIEHLTNSNIVDALVGVDLRERLGHVEWMNAVLTLELVVPSEGGRPEQWFDDVETLIGVSYKQLDNVNRLLIRIVQSDGDRRRLLAAVDVRRGDAWLSSEWGELRHSDPVHDELWRQRLRLSFTSEWWDRFGKPEGYSARSIGPRSSDIAN